MTLVSILKILLSCEDDEVERSVQNLLYKMLLVGRDVCFILAVVFTVVAVITNSQNNNRRVPPTRPFFNDGTWVDDYFAGELYYAILKAAKYDVVFLMLYAPWDADSQNARSEFETACRYFHKKVYCAAVNCWQANGGCKALFENVAMYPLFLLDLRSIPSIKYNGEYVSSHMIQFLSSAIKPLKRIHSVEEFYTLRSTCDALVVSFLPGYTWYKHFYTASLRYLEQDPRRDTCWAFVTDKKLAGILDLEFPSVKLYLWNDTKVYKDTFKDIEIIKWVQENVYFLTQWVFLRNSRNNLISELLEHNPSVILFTPRNMYLENIPSYLSLKRAALLYKNCFQDLDLENQLPYITRKRQEIFDDFSYWDDLCDERFIYMQDAYELFLESNSLNHISDGLQNVTKHFYKNKHGNTSRNSTLGMNLRYDKRSPENLVLFHIRDKCRWLKMLKKGYMYSYLREKSPQFTGDYRVPDDLCSLNRTFNFFAVDTLLYSYFSKALGINLNNYKDQTAIVIVNNKVEEAYVLSDRVDDSNALLQFMINISNHSTPRWLKSTKDASLYTHRYKTPENLTSEDFYVMELHSETFQPVVFDSSKHTVVYYYSPFCSYCQVSAYTFLTVAHMLKNFTNILFARIDGENNDLPWHLVPLSFPSIMVFPAKSKSENKVYPMSEELTVENLLDFVLSNIDVDIKIKYMIDDCEKYRKIEHPTACVVFDRCIDNVKNHCLQLINNLVNNYTGIDSSALNVSVTANSLYNTLQLLKSVYLRLENT